MSVPPTSTMITTHPPSSMMGSSASQLSMRWDAGLVIISFLCAFQASYTAIQILQMRINVWLIAVAAFCFSVSGIWAMHFVGMAAMHMSSDVSYDLGWTIASILFAFFPCFGAFWSLDYTLVRIKRKKKQAVIDAQNRELELNSGHPTPHDPSGEASTTRLSPVEQPRADFPHNPCEKSHLINSLNEVVRLAVTDSEIEMSETTTHSNNNSPPLRAANRSFSYTRASPNTNAVAAPPQHPGNSCCNDDVETSGSNTTSTTHQDELRARLSRHRTLTRRSAAEGGDNANNNSNSNNDNEVENDGGEHPDNQQQHHRSTIAEEEAMLEDTRDISLKAHITAFRAAPHHVLVMGGALIALGACLMHYLGMHAMSVPDAVRTMDVGVIIASCIVALIAGTAALYFAFILPSTREFTIPTALIAAAAVSGMHYVGMYGIRYEYPADSAHVMDMHTMHGSGESSIEPFIIYIIFASSAISSASLALSSYFYRKSLQRAADDAELRASLIMAGKFEELGDCGSNEDTSRLDPIMARLKLSNAKLGEQMRKLRSFLPASLLAQFEAQEGFTSADDDSDDDGEEGEDGLDEGSLSLQLGPYSGRSGRGLPMSSSGSPPNQTLTAGSAVHESSASLLNPKLLVTDDTALLPTPIAANSTRSADQLASTMLGTKGSPTKGGGKESHQQPHTAARQQYNLSLQHRTIAVLSLNCRNFTKTIHDNSPQLIGMYANFIDGLCLVAKQQRGVMDIVHGDRVLMTFNASLRNAQYGRSAAAAAVLMARDVGAPGTVGCVSIGLATGAARCGNMGSKQMMKYNVCGPVVGNAVRAMHLATSLHASHGVHVAGFITEEMRMAVRARALDIVHWQHMANPIIISEIVGNVSTGTADEWMYELETCSGSDPFAKVNAAFATVLAHARKNTGGLIGGISLTVEGACDLGAPPQWPPSHVHASQSYGASLSLANGNSLMKRQASTDKVGGVKDAFANSTLSNSVGRGGGGGGANAVVVAPSLSTAVTPTTLEGLSAIF